MKDLTIVSVDALPCSVPLRQAVTQGLGQVTKRDTVIVKVTTADGLTGYGESYNGRAPLAVALIGAVNRPITGTSANISDADSCASAEEVDLQLGVQLPLILDGGRTEGKLPSTVIDLTGERCRILPAGAIPDTGFEELFG